MIYVDDCLVLQRIGIAKSLYFNQVLDTLYAHVKTLKLPKPIDSTEHDEKRLMVQDADFLRIEEMMSALLEFVAPFVFLIQQSREMDAANDLVSFVCLHCRIYIKQITTCIM